MYLAFVQYQHTAVYKDGDIVVGQTTTFIFTKTIDKSIKICYNIYVNKTKGV